MLPLAVLAGGFATRLGLITSDVPKNMLMINGKPFVDWQLDLLSKNGYKKLVFCVSHKSQLIQDYLGDGSKFHVEIEYSFDGTSQLGTGGAIQNALSLLGPKFGVIYGDSLLPINYSDVENHFLNAEKLALMTVFRNENRFDASNVQFDQGILYKYEKGKVDSKMQHIDYGLTYFKREAFLGRGELKEFDLAEMCHDLANNGNIGGFEVFEEFFEIGSQSGINRTSKYLRERSV
jgi:NDP-sugar pyrophosphorylase family protein